MDTDRAQAALREVRNRELQALHAAFEAAADGACRVVFVVGPAGAGKSTLVEALRPHVRARGGDFVAARLDPHAEDDVGAIVAALDDLVAQARLDLGDDFAAMRGRLLRSLGELSQLAGVVPALRDLLDDLPGPGRVDPAHAAARMEELFKGVLRAFVSPQRPLVLNLENLQWSAGLMVRLVESIHSSPDIRGLLVAVTCREMPMRAREPGGPEIVRLANLQPQQSAQLLARLLGVRRQRAVALAEILDRRSCGNPADTLELLHGLIEEGLVHRKAGAWTWKADAARKYADVNDACGVARLRASRLPDDARHVLQVLACLEGDVPFGLLKRACDVAESECERAIGILENARFIRRDGDRAARIRFAGERMRTAAAGTLDGADKARRHLAIARRLAAHDDLLQVAAEQYAAASAEVLEIDECRQASALLRRAAAQCRQLAKHESAARMAHAAVELLRRVDGDGQLLAGCEIEYHVALCSIGQLDEADRVYERIESRGLEPAAGIEALCAQVSSLTRRGRRVEALTIGLDVLNALGVSLTDLEPAKTQEMFGRLKQWVDTFELERECDRAEASSPRVVAIAKMACRLQAHAFIGDGNLLAGLIFHSLALWEQHGPCAPLAVSLTYASNVAIAMANDWRTGYRAARNMLELCEARRWEPETSLARYYFVLTAQHWFEPLERRVKEAQRAREGLLAAGDLQTAAFSCRNSAMCIFECGPSLGRYAEELDTAFALARRAANGQLLLRLAGDRQMMRALRGDTLHPATFDSGDFDEALYLKDASADPGIAYYWLNRALVSAIYGDAEALSRHSRRACELFRVACTPYPTVWAHWLAGMAAAWRLQGGDGSSTAEDRHADLHALESTVQWLHERALDAPFNFRHMVLHLRGEEAWAAGELESAARLLDEALSAVEERRRPWHRALILERVALLNRFQGLRHAEHEAMAECRSAYAEWGACGKVAQLDAAYGSMHVQDAGTRPQAPPRTPARVDLLPVLQLLASGQDTRRLRLRAEQVLAEVTDAERVSLVLWEPEVNEWIVRGHGAVGVPLSSARDMVPLSVFAYVERTRESLLLADALGDERFARDSYFRGMERCSLIVVPLLSHGTVRAMLLLENRAGRGAFSHAQLEIVMMIAGQLGVSLTSAELYERLHDEVRSQTLELEVAQARLMAEARKAGMAQIASNVLHNVRNVLNSVSVSVHVLTERVSQSRISRVGDVALLLEENRAQLRRFCQTDERGKILPEYVGMLADEIRREHEDLLIELGRLETGVEHIKNVVAMQQSHAGARGVLETISITELVDDALRMQYDALVRGGVQVRRQYAHLPPVPLDKTRVMQILVNLIENARHAMQDSSGPRHLTVSVRQESGEIELNVQDNGCGIAPENAKRIFSHGFTTKKGGHGFGLHSCALAALEMGGSLVVQSAGKGAGASFTLRVPVTTRASALAAETP